MLWVYGHYKYLILLCLGPKHQDLQMCSYELNKYEGIVFM